MSWSLQSLLLIIMSVSQCLLPMSPQVCPTRARQLGHSQPRPILVPLPSRL
jgi:hypothetical protein